MAEQTSTVTAAITGMVTWSGGKILLEEGRTRADREHPLVRERPELWRDDDTPKVDLPAGPRVERATRAPGERRGGKRG